MTWEQTCVLLTKYYGISPLDIPELTLYQVAYHIRNVGWLESHGEEGARITSSLETIMGGRPGKVPSIHDITIMAKKLNPGIVIPED